MSLVMILSTAITAWGLWNFLALLLNYNAARHIGLPVIIGPFSPMNPFWILATRTLPIVRLLNSSPFGLGKWTRCTYMGWSFDDKCALHKELGRAFTLVTPGSNEVWIADPDAAHAVLSRRKEYVKPRAMYEPLNVFGPNLNTVEGDDWQRHRKLTAPSFNEKCSSLVWEEALSQARDMLQSWTDQGASGTRDTVMNTATLTLHVLTGAGFGISYPYDKGVQSPPPGYDLSYRDALLTVLQSVVILAIIPKSLMDFRFSPAKLRRVSQATREFQMYMDEMLNTVRNSKPKQRAQSKNLLNALVQASEEARRSSHDGVTRNGLTDKEIFGNIFIYNLAGYETTANTLATGIVLLAAYPEWQEWLAEEINLVFDDDESSPKWKYEEAFPRLNRCLAVMFEILRLYGSNVFIPKATGSFPCILRVSGSNRIIPPDTFTMTNLQALHTDPQSWGSDSLTFRPSRWLLSTVETGASAAMATFIEPPAGAFVPWADGPRVCPGRKLAQVEFIAVMVALFRKHRVQPLLKEGERMDSGLHRLRGIVNDSGISAVTVQMRRPRDAALTWTRVEV